MNMIGIIKFDDNLRIDSVWINEKLSDNDEVELDDGHTKNEAYGKLKSLGFKSLEPLKTVGIEVSKIVGIRG